MKFRHLTSTLLCTAIILPGAFAQDKKPVPEPADEFKAKIVTQLDASIYGQAQAKELLSNVAKLHVTSTNSQPTALSVMLFGGSGVGKSSLVEAYAKSVELPSVRIPVSALGDAAQFTRLVSDALSDNPKSVILIENLELSTKEVMNEIITLLSTKKIGTHSADKALFAFTTTSGKNLIDQWVSTRPHEPRVVVGYDNPSKSQLQAIIDQNAQKQLPRLIDYSTSHKYLARDGIPAAFLEIIGNRVSPAFPPSFQEFTQVFIHKFTSALKQVEASKKITIAFDNKNLSKMFKKILPEMYHPLISYEELVTEVQKLVDDTIADAQLAGKIQEGKTLTLEFDLKTMKMLTVCDIKFK